MDLFLFLVTQQHSYIQPQIGWPPENGVVPASESQAAWLCALKDHASHWIELARNGYFAVAQMRQ